MPSRVLENINVESFERMPSPEEVQQALPVTEAAADTVVGGRAALQAILDRRDPRLFLLVGPCSIHDPLAGLEYALRLRGLAEEVADSLLLVMRVYFEKPRTSTGWKGLINDPRMDDSFHVEEGVRRAREFLLKVAELGLPAATEALDPIIPQYIGDLVSWASIGARTSESQTHREMASGLSTPVGFKNGRDGDLEVAINGILSAASPHSFLGLSGQGTTAIVRTRGNAYGHLVLRGGSSRPNYDTISIAFAERALGRAGLPQNIVVDCSHANSTKNPDLQPLVMADCAHQVVRGNRSIVGLMVESFLEGGHQPIPADPAELRYGCSITDGCLGWPETEAMVRETRLVVQDALQRRFQAPE
jgi:3-deoxy-7-phosphoheptulonate synthase